MASFADQVNTFVDRSHVKKEVVKAFGLKSPVLGRIMKNTMLAGGRSITWNAHTGNSGLMRSGAPGWVTAPEQQSTTSQPTLTSKDLVLAVWLSEKIAKRNRKDSKAALANYITSEMNNRMEETAEELGAMLYGDGSATTNIKGEPKENLTGIGAFSSRTVTYAGLSPATYTRWKANVINMTSATGGTHVGLTFTGTAPTLAELETRTSAFYFPRLLGALIRGCTFNNEGPDLITMNELYYSIADLYIQDKERLVNANGVKNVGPTIGFSHNGVDIMLDRLCSDTEVCAWRTKDLFIAGLPADTDKFEPFVNVPGSDYMWSKWDMEGEIVFQNPRMFGRIINLAASPA
jgi:hypothetical protein